MKVKYLLASLIGAIIIPLVAFIADNVDYVGGALAAVPFIDLIPLLFVESRSSVQTTIMGDFVGQSGAVSGIVLCFFLIHFTTISINICVFSGLLLAIFVNAGAYLAVR